MNKEKDYCLIKSDTIIEVNSNFHHLAGENLFEKKINVSKNIVKSGMNGYRI